MDDERAILTEPERLELITRLKYLMEGSRKILDALVSYNEGETSAEELQAVMESVEDAFTESAAERRGVETNLALIIEHLLKLAFCDNDQQHEHWKGEIQTVFRKKLIVYLKWARKSKATALINHANSVIAEIYQDALALYRSDAKVYLDLVNGLESLPSDYPGWTVKELMDDEIDTLFSRLETEKVSK